MTALIVVPPLVKYASGPLLGPAMLAGAVEGATVLDLNIRYLRSRLSTERHAPSGFAGDHDKPVQELRRIQRDFAFRLAELLPPASGSEDPALSMMHSHLAVEQCARELAEGPEGTWIGAQLPEEAPALVGISILFSGQVPWALATAMLVRRRWPTVPILAGGPHITALRDAIAADPRYGRHIDGFVFGHAEQTFREAVLAARRRTAMPVDVIRAGSGSLARARSDASRPPRFQDLELYGVPRLTLPAQSARGCAYGRCRFCTYPQVESGETMVPDSTVLAVVEQAEALGAVVSFKDSLITVPGLARLTGTTRGRVEWSGCTKLNRGLDKALLTRLRDAGCSTLELGLETLAPWSQHLVDKKQSIALFDHVLDAAARAELPLVVNYITGFPGEAPEEGARWLQTVRDRLDGRPGLVARLEHNTFQMERLAPLARDHRIEITHSWPWATVVEWRWRGEWRNRGHYEALRHDHPR